MMEIDGSDLQVLANRKRGNNSTSHQTHLKRQRTSIESLAHETFGHDDYTVGWICALSMEMAAAQAMLDNVHPSLPIAQGDSNTYTLGDLAGHNIVIACLPAGHYGTNNAAMVASHLRRSFPRIDKGLLVGIGGGAPRPDADIRLGDIVVSFDVVQYDFGKATSMGDFSRTSIPVRPAQSLLTAIAHIRASHDLSPSQVPDILSGVFEKYPKMAKYARPNLEDHLFDNNMQHDSSNDNCMDCNPAALVNRQPRQNNNPMIHYGRVASGNQVIKNGILREKLSKELDAICFEMEAAGVMDTLPCLVIRGICDYSDSHKNKEWQHYSAITAAAYTKELLLKVHMTKHLVGLENIASAHNSASLDTMESQRHGILETLEFDEIETRHETIKKAYAKTCQWFLSDPAYVAWQNEDLFSDHHGFLWISGKPGAGKSTLMKYLFTCAKKQYASDTNSAVVSFFFNARGVDLERSTAGMYRSLLIQVFRIYPCLQSILDGCLKRTYGELLWKVEALEELFQHLIRGLGHRRLICFIDALDECDQTQVLEMVEFFQGLGDLAYEKSKFLICFSSRHYPYIEIENGKRLSLEEQQGHQKDLEDYIRSRLQAGKGKGRQEVVEKLIIKSSGIFMWAVLVVDILNEEYRAGRLFAVKKRLNELPEKLSELFKDILTRDNKNLNDLLLCIQWILFAKRPLSCREFYAAVSFGLDPEPQNLEPWDEVLTIDDMTRFVSSSSKGLAEITKSKSKTVQFIHESVRDFLLKDNGIYQLWPDYREGFVYLSHERLKNHCYAYTKADLSEFVSMSELRRVETTKEERDTRLETVNKISAHYPLALYASSCLFHHAEAASTGLSQGRFLASFNVEPWIFLYNIFEKFKVRRFEPTANLVYILADQNLTRLAGEAISCNHSKNFSGPGGRYKTALLAASANNNLELATQLSEVEPISQYEHDDKGWNALCWAAHNGWDSMVKILLEKVILRKRPFSVNTRRKALFIAVEKGHKGVTELLLEYVEIFSTNERAETVLPVAIRQGDEAMVKLLLSRTKEVQLRVSVYGQSLLCFAVESGHETMVRLFLSRGCSPRMPNLQGLTPGHLAIKRSHSGVLRLLLNQEGVYPYEVEECGQSLFQIAAAMGKGDALKVILEESPAPPGFWRLNGSQLLRSAVEMQNAEIVKLLSTNGVDVNIKTTWGESILLDTIRSGYEDIVESLLAAKDIQINGYEDGMTPLVQAVYSGNDTIVRLLLGREDIDVNQQSLSGDTALIIAVRTGRAACVRQLLTRQDINADLADFYGRTPLSFASERGHERCVRLLLKRQDVNADLADVHGRTPLSFAYELGHEACVKILLAK